MLISLLHGDCHAFCGSCMYMYEQIISYTVNCCVFFHLCLFPSRTVLVFLNLFLLIYAELGNLPRIIL